MRYLLRRVRHALFLVLGVSALSFALLDLAPGDYLSEMRLDPRVSPETLSALRARYGLDRPLPERYARWLASVARGEMGYSFSYDAPAGPLLLGRAKETLLLTGTALVATWLLALPLGILSAARPRSWPARATSGAIAVLLSIPELLLALLLLLLAVRTGLFPAGGLASPVPPDGAFARARDVAWHMVLPVATLVLTSLPLLVRHVRAGVASALEAPFVMAARSHGIGESRIRLWYALPAAANPLASLFGLSVAGLLGGSLVVEVVMSWPGLGPLLIDAILARDIHVVVGAATLSTLFLVAGSLAADLLLTLADPRVRAEEPP